MKKNKKIKKHRYWVCQMERNLGALGGENKNETVPLTAAESEKAIIRL